MGVCRCRSVTSMFCFDHRKNVCENCVITDHPACTVRSYLQWLQDSNHEGACGICLLPFSEDPSVVRLTCFDLFHEACLMSYCDRAMQHKQDQLEALKSIKCPSCAVPVIPLAAHGSILVDSLRAVLVRTAWRAAVEALMPSTSIVKGREAPLLNEAPIANTAQPNSRSTIDMPRSSMVFDEDRYVSWKRWYFKLVRDTSSIRSSSLSQIAWNCITLRNIRCVSRGVSPRLLLLVVALALFSTALFVALNSSVAASI